MERQGVSELCNADMAKIQEEVNDYMETQDFDSVRLPEDFRRTKKGHAIVSQTVFKDHPVCSIRTLAENNDMGMVVNGSGEREKYLLFHRNKAWPIPEGWRKHLSTDKNCVKMKIGADNLRAVAEKADKHAFQILSCEKNKKGKFTLKAKWSRSDKMGEKHRRTYTSTLASAPTDFDQSSSMLTYQCKNMQKSVDIMHNAVLKSKRDGSGHSNMNTAALFLNGVSRKTKWMKTVDKRSPIVLVFDGAYFQFMEPGRVIREPQVSDEKMHETEFGKLKIKFAKNGHSFKGWKAPETPVKKEAINAPTNSGSSDADTMSVATSSQAADSSPVSQTHSSPVYSGTIEPFYHNASGAVIPFSGTPRRSEATDHVLPREYLPAPLKSGLPRPLRNPRSFQRLLEAPRINVPTPRKLIKAAAENRLIPNPKRMLEQRLANWELKRLKQKIGFPGLPRIGGGRRLAEHETVTGFSPVTNLVTLALITLLLALVVFMSSNLKVETTNEEEIKGDELV